MDIINRPAVRLLLAALFVIFVSLSRTQANTIKETYGIAPDGTPLQWVVYTPATPGPWPVMIVIHGGEFKEGSPDSTAQCSQDLANAGYLALSITYRLAPPGAIAGQVSDGRYPQQNDDVKMAVHAARIDPRCNGKVGGIGGSSGGYHVAYDAATGIAGDDRVDVGISLSGAYDFSDFSPNANIAAFTSDVLNFMACAQTDTMTLQGASPAYLVTANVPPLFLINTQDDPMPYSQLPDMTTKLDSLGVKNYKSLTLPGDAHAFDYWESVKDEVIPFLAAAFSGSLNITPTPAPSATPTPSPKPGQPTAGRLVNVSTRAFVGSGDQVMIGGFIITGTQQKSVVLRALGPSLAQNGVSGALANPTLSLYDSTGRLIAENDNFAKPSSQIASLGLTPPNNDESLISATLVPGSYTAIVSGMYNSSGTALFELYDLDPISATVSNISTRGNISSASDPMIAGFIVNGAENCSVLVRALGPSLKNTPNALPNPKLELHNSDGSLLFANDDWRSTQEAQIINTTIPPADDKEAAILATLAPGSYTAIVSDSSNGSGIALVEVYNLSNE